jgi:SNF2 family DNA or RNA helicase
MTDPQEFALDQVVWVKTGDKHEEPGTVVEVGYSYCATESDDEEGDARNSGGMILVRLHVSAYKLVCDPSQLRPLEEAETTTTTTSSSQQRRTSRRLSTNRSMVTPSPKTLASASSISSESKNCSYHPQSADPFPSEDIDKKPAAKRKQKDCDLESSLESNDTPSSDTEASSPYFKRTKHSDSSSTTSEAEETRKPAPKKLSKAVVIDMLGESGASSEESDSNTSDDDADDRPFTVDYAPTSRATCRRCDTSILKDSLRVSHVPLFRGKPGFRVSRHLECAIFSEDIHKAEDVGGWKKLSTADYEALALRVEESKLEVQKENEELEPDELVQVAFQGETRQSPPGLVATLLPFQVEGHAWMYHQEVHVPEIRGGILADEMGMVRNLVSEERLDRWWIYPCDSLLNSSCCFFFLTGQDYTNTRRNP